MANLRANRITSTEVFETTGSVQFDGSGDALSLGIINGTDYEMGSSDFTIECWFNSSSSTSLQSSFWNPILSLPWHGNSNSYSQIWIAFCGSAFGSLATGELHARFLLSDSTDMYLGTKKTNLYNDNQWHHIAVVRNGSNFLFFVDGILESSANSSLSLNTDLQSLTGWIGAYDNHDTTSGTSIEAGSFNGHISNFRILKGQALYTENFTPPTRELEVIPNTVLLCAQSKTQANREATGKTITVNGNAVASELTPGLLTNVVKSGGSSAITGSVEFDGDKDYLQITESSSDFTFGTGDFTIEFWVYLSTNRKTLYLDWRSSGGPQGSRITLYGEVGSLRFYDGSDRITTSNPDINQWSHISLCKSGTSTKLFVNGIQSGSTYTDTNNYLSPQSSSGIYIGGINFDYNYALSGFISNLRILKGTALYTSNFIPPTRKLTRLPGTVLLCCQDSNDPTTEATGKTITGYGDLQKADGVELVTNGDFSNTNASSVTSWDDISVGTGTISEGSGYASLNRVDGNNSGRIGQGMNLVTEKVYTVSFDLVSGSTSGVQLRQYNSSTQDISTVIVNFLIADGVGKKSHTFTSQSGYDGLMLIPIDNTSTVARVDNFSVTLAETRNGASDFTPQVGSDGSVEFAGPTTINTENYFYLPTGPTEQRSRGRGVWAGGYRSPNALSDNRNTIDYINITSMGNAIDFGDRTTTRSQGLGSCASETRGVFAGGRGYNDPGSAPSPHTATNTIDYITFASTSNALDFGDLSSGNSYIFAGCSNSTRGIFNIGTNVGYINIASKGDTTTFNAGFTSRNTLTGFASPTRGIFAGGGVPGAINTIEYITIQSTGNALDFGDLTFTGHAMGCANTTRAVVFTGGFPSAPSTDICYITMASTGNAQDFGDTTQTIESNSAGSGCASATRAVRAGGYVSPGVDTNAIEYVTIASTGNASDFGDLTEARRAFSGCSDSHGGLG